jgi:hypothetical protein
MSKKELTAYLVIIAFGIVVALFAERPPKKPGPTWQGAGEVAGEKATKFSKGFARGAWDTITGRRQ